MTLICETIRDNQFILITKAQPCITVKKGTIIFRYEHHFSKLASAKPFPLKLEIWHRQGNGLKRKLPEDSLFMKKRALLGIKKGCDTDICKYTEHLNVSYQSLFSVSHLGFVYIVLCDINIRASMSLGLWEGYWSKMPITDFGRG